MPRLLAARTRLELNWRSWEHRACFREPTWQRRVSLTIPPAARALIASGRGIVLATAHYGALMFLGRWLVCRDVTPRPVGVLVNDPAWIDRRHRRLPDGRRLAPRIIAPHQLRAAHRLLSRGGILIAAMDFPRGRSETVPLGDRTLTLSTGPLRLAAHTNAAVIPCVAREKWWWRGGVSIADPLPDSLLHDHPKACASIARTLMLWIRQDPFQCSDILLNQFGTGPAQT